MTEQMEVPLWETLRSAQIMPEQVDFEVLLAGGGLPQSAILLPERSE